MSALRKTPRSTRVRSQTARSCTGRVLGVTVASAGLVALGSTTASAHVSATPTVTAAGSYSLVTLSVGHGCDGSPTTRMDISVPEGVNAVTPTIAAGWTATKVMTKLDEPITDAHGTSITERVSEVAYTAESPLADGYRQAFTLQIQVPDQVGQTLRFPTVQGCETGETAWIEIPREGQSEDDLEHPAPGFTITTAAAADGHGDDDSTTAPTVDEASADSDTSDTSLVTWAALGLGVAGAALGGAALARTRRR